MTRIQLMPGCPFGGCENGYCACFERDLDDLEICGEYDPEDAELLEDEDEVLTVHGRDRRIETVPIPIDNYPPATDPLGATP